MGVLASDLPYHSLPAVIITTITGSLSAISSCCLILVILRSQSKLNTVYHRITFGMSCADIMSSVAMALTTIPLPKSLPNDIIELEANFVDYDNWAGMKLGNVQTCSAQGFFFTFGILAMYVYNLMLCVYYVCTLVFHMKEKLIIRRVEPALHICPITLGLGCALNFLFFNAYNPNGWEAWCAPHSVGCDWSDENPKCIRGTKIINEQLQTELVVLVLVMGIVSVASLLLVVAHVYRLDRVMKFTATVNRKMYRNAYPRDHVMSRIKNHHANTKVVCVQALAYLVAFVTTLIFPALQGTNVFGTDTPPLIHYLKLVFTPLQGFFNFVSII